MWHASLELAAPLLLCTALSAQSLPARANVELRPTDTKAGYIALLLINETPFPGERGWVSEENSKAGMLAILWVCHGRIHYIPPGYRQYEIAAVSTKDIIDVITAGGEKGQCDGFYRDASGRFRAVPRVQERMRHLLKFANRGRPGKFARLMIHARGLADAYVADGIRGADRFARLTMINGIPVTGRAYSWMTDKDCYRPGGDFVRIPDDREGVLGGNRFFTLRRR